MSDIAAAKAAARAQAMTRRSAAFAAAGPGRAGLLSEVLAGHRGVPLSGYLAIGDEIDPLPAMQEAVAYGPVAVPVIKARATPLAFACWEPGCALVPGVFGVQVPRDQVFMTPEILIVPLLSFDRAGNRLGYGGGFYDRTLEALRAKGPTLAIGFAFAGQEVAQLPLEPVDQPLDMIVTEREVISL